MIRLPRPHWRAFAIGFAAALVIAGGLAIYGYRPGRAISLWMARCQAYGLALGISRSGDREAAILAMSYALDYDDAVAQYQPGRSDGETFDRNLAAARLCRLLRDTPDDPRAQEPCNQAMAYFKKADRAALYAFIDDRDAHHPDTEGRP